MTKRATLRELKQDEATARRQVKNLRKLRDGLAAESHRILLLIVDTNSMLANIQQAIKRREKEKR